jgi:hypothetical protein
MTYARSAWTGVWVDSGQQTKTSRQTTCSSGWHLATLPVAIAVSVLFGVGCTADLADSLLLYLVLTALVTSSGPLGLSAIFPPAEMIYKTRADDEHLRKINYLAPPHLPLTATWQEADFSLESVLSESTLPGEPVKLRRWSMQLLSRYLYMSGKTPSHFHMARNPEHVQGVFKMVDKAKDVSPLATSVYTQLFRAR